jgi:hypothetical protein
MPPRCVRQGGGVDVMNAAAEIVRAGRFVMMVGLGMFGLAKCIGAAAHHNWLLLCLFGVGGAILTAGAFVNLRR